MISQLELRNFKRHTAANFTFGEGLTSIAGPNAQGKTTLLKGILFALLGASAAGSKEHLTTRGSAGDTGVSLRLKVPVHGEVRIERTLKGAKIFSADGTLIANGTTPTIKLIEEAYGMSSADLQLLMYSRQGESQALLAMGAAALQRTVERLAKTGLVDKVLDLISRDLSRLEGELAGMGSLPDLARLRKEREHSLSVVAAQQQVLATVNARLAVSVASEQSLQQRYNTARDHEVLAAGWQSKLDASGPRLAALQQSVEDYRTTLENLPDYPQTEFDTRYAEIERLNRRQQDLDGRGRAVRNAELEIIKLKAEAARLETRIDQSQRVAGDIEQAEETLRRLTEQRATLRQALATAVTAVKQAEIALSAAVCGECHRPYSAEELKLANARFEATCQLRDAAATELDANAGPLKQATDHLAQLRKDFHPGCVAELERVRQALEREAASKLINLVEFETLTLLEAEAEAIHLTLPTLRSELADMTQQQGQRNRTKILLDTAVAAMQDMAHDRQEAERQLALVPPIEDPQGLTSQLQTAQHQSQQLRATLQQAGQEMAVAAREAEALQQAIENGQSIKVQRAELERGLAGRKKLQSWLRKSRADLMLELWEGLFHYASHLLTSTTGGQIRRVYRREGDIVIDEGGEPVPVSELSGFQRSLVGLALRVGLSRVFYGGDLPLMLDEPTADASEDNAARVAGMLQALKSQVIIVSHRLGDAANAQTLIQL